MAIITVLPGTNAIQNAVNVATPGDIILVNEGVYSEAVTINTSNIRLVAANNKVFVNGNNTLGTAFTLNGVTGVEINRFHIANYMVDGIHLENSSFNLIIRNTITNVAEDGIDIATGNGNLIYRNTIKNIGNNPDFDSGIEVSSSNNWIVENTVSDNTSAGLFLSSGTNSNGVVDNTFDHNAGSGVDVSGDFNILQRNKVKDNRDNGILLQAPANDNFIFRNDLNDNEPNNIVNNGVDNNFLGNDQD